MASLSKLGSLLDSFDPTSPRTERIRQLMLSVYKQNREIADLILVQQQEIQALHSIVQTLANMNQMRLIGTSSKGEGMEELFHAEHDHEEEEPEVSTPTAGYK